MPAPRRLSSRVFTGLVQAVGIVHASTPTSAGIRLAIHPDWPHHPTAGESVSVSGCCLTLADDPRRHAGLLLFDAVPETLRRTTLGTLAPGCRVNLERAATPSTLLGGHLVQGHVDAVGTVLDVHSADECRLRIDPAAAADDMPLIDSIFIKGSIALDGVSLTVAAVGPNWFEVALIPATLAATTLAALGPGSRCNIEADVIAKMVVQRLRTVQPQAESRRARHGD